MDIFDYFAGHSNCLIADLKYNPDKRLRYETAKSIPDDAFPLEDWNALVSYLYGQKLAFESVEQARQHLKNEWRP